MTDKLTFRTFQQNSPPTKLPVASYRSKFLLNICPGRQSNHDRTAQTAWFLWKHGLFASQSVVLYTLNAQMMDQEKRTKQFQCSSIEKIENQTQWKFSTCLVVPLHAILTMATNLDPPFTLHVTPAPVSTTATTA